MHRRGLNVRKTLLSSVLPALRLFPPRTSARLVATIGRAEYALLPGVRQRVDAAVARGQVHLGGHWDRARVGRELAGNQILWRTRDRLLDGLPDRKVEPALAIEGRDGLDAALAEGRGVVLLGNHFGAHMLAAHWLTRAEYPLRLFMERPRHISRFLARSFDTDGPTGQRKLFLSRRATPAESAGSILRAAKVLNAGMVVLIAADVRWAGQHTVAAPFLGKAYTFSATWALLAAMTGAPVVPVFGRVGPDGTHHVEFLEPYHLPPTARSPEGAAPWVRSALQAIEEQVRRHPASSNDYFFWCEMGDEFAVAGPDESRA